MGALKQQKEVLSALFYNDNDLLCRKKEKKKKQWNASNVSNDIFHSNFEHQALWKHQSKVGRL